MIKSLLYLDNCCFNRPFDDQTQIAIRKETEAKLSVQDIIRAGEVDIVWSFVLEYENERNPFPKRRVFTSSWAERAMIIIRPQPEIFQRARELYDCGLAALDALHVACAEYAGASCFLTTDKGILKKGHVVGSVKMMTPVEFITEWKERPDDGC